MFYQTIGKLLAQGSDDLGDDGLGENDLRRQRELGSADFLLRVRSAYHADRTARRAGEARCRHSMGCAFSI